MRQTLLTLLLLLLVNKGFAQKDELHFKRLTTLQGLSQSWARCIYQDDIGHMWFGTSDGLNRYDGYDIKVYLPKSGDSTAIGSMVINQISKKSKNELWICTNNGIYTYNRLTDNFHPFPYLRKKEVACLTEDAQHNLWIGTLNGLYRLNTSSGAFKKFTHDKSNPLSISHNRIRCIYQDSYGNIWIGTESGLNLYNNEGESFTRYLKSPKLKGLLGDSIFSILEDKAGRLWIGIAQAGLEVFENYKDRPKEGRFHKIMGGSPMCLMQDKSDRLWVGHGSGKGLDIIDLNGYHIPDLPKTSHYEQRTDDDESLSDNTIESLFLDKFGDVWVGTYGGGINYFSDRAKKFRNHRMSSNPKTTISSNLVNAFYEDQQYVWVGTERGLDRVDKASATIRHFTHNPKDKASLAANAVYRIYKDSHGNLWVGTWNGGLSLYNPGPETFKNYLPSKDPGALSNPNVFAINEDKRGFLWVGTIGGGLYRLDPKTRKFTNFSHDDASPASLYGNSVNCIFTASDGTLYITEYGALDIFNEKTNTFKHFVHSDSDHGSISEGYILSVFEDSQKHIWVATNSGLNLFHKENQTFTLYSTNNGLPNNTIQGILEDRKGNLWISTNKGLAVFINGASAPTKPVFRIYNKDDGLPANEFAVRAAYQNKSGHMYFGTSRGYTEFDPAEIVDNKVPPVVVLNEFSLVKTTDEREDKRLSLIKKLIATGKIDLNYNESNFYIAYSALNYLNTEKNQYKYRLEGYESGWHYVGSWRLAAYTNINPGKYTFMVMGSNNDNVWSNEPCKLVIIIHPPWWKTLLFRLISITLIILMIYGVFKLRVKMLERQKRLLEETVTKRTNQLEEMNTMLEERQEEISIQNEELSRHRNNLEQLIEQRTAELEAAKTKAEESDRLKSAFLANMSHEIRTPMNAIIGFSSLLPDLNYSDAERRQFIEIINGSCQSLMVLIDDIIDISLIEANQITFSPDDIDITKVLVEMESFYRLKANNDLEIKFLNNHEQEFHMTTDLVRFRQILNNLINNALKFTEKGYVHFGFEPKENEVLFYVSDTGIGIDDKDKENVFRHFYKVEKISHRQLYRGTGIGLSICLKLVENMGGKIWVESKVNEGSSFKFTLPLVSAASKTTTVETPSATQDDDLKGLKLLIAEDEPVNYELLAKILKPKGALIYWAKNGEEAIEYLNNNDWAENIVVLMDIKMPMMDGYETTRLIKNKNKNIKVIAVTAYALTNDKKRIIEHGFDDYISKPINKAILLSKIAKLKS